MFIRFIDSSSKQIREWRSVNVPSKGDFISTDEGELVVDKVKWLSPDEIVITLG